jgi:hypothetical protein
MEVICSLPALTRAQASDGGAAACQGSFASVLTTDDTNLAECGGLVEGAVPKSFRAKAYGLLAILWLVFILRWFYMTTNQAMLLALYSNSESLLKRLTESLSLTYPVPRRTLFSEADAELQILNTFATFPSMPTLCYVEGYQGTKYPDRPLKWEAQLNKRCDEIVTDHLEAATDILSTTPFFPASKASLTVGVMTLTHHIPSQLRFFAGLSSYRFTSVFTTTGHRQSTRQSTGLNTLRLPLSSLFSPAYSSSSGSTVCCLSSSNSSSTTKAPLPLAPQRVAVPTKTRTISSFGAIRTDDDHGRNSVQPCWRSSNAIILIHHFVTSCCSSSDKVSSPTTTQSHFKP